jgi:hypothetical protein
MSKRYTTKSLIELVSGANHTSYVIAVNGIAYDVSYLIQALLMKAAVSNGTLIIDPPPQSTDLKQVTAYLISADAIKIYEKINKSACEIKYIHDVIKVFLNKEINIPNRTPNIAVSELGKYTDVGRTICSWLK